MEPLRVVVLGTGTDVGKTHVTCALLAAARAAGLRACGLKPVATGLRDAAADAGDDARAHAEAAGRPPVLPVFGYAWGVSPHLAAEQEGRPIDLWAVASAAAALEARDFLDVLVVEGAGGVFSPLSRRTTNVHLVRALRPARVVVVAPDRLGVLHDVRATALAAGTQSLPIDAWALSAPEAPDASTGRNAAELERVGAALVAAVFPRSPPGSAESRAAADRVWAHLRAGAQARVED
jgi:dethiobiotin synthetase